MGRFYLGLMLYWDSGQLGVYQFLDSYVYWGHRWVGEIRYGTLSKLFETKRLGAGEDGFKLLIKYVGL